MSINSFYAIANNDYLFLYSAKDSQLYNNIAVQAQQVVEKYLKHLVYTYCIEHNEAERALKTHNLVKLNNILVESGIDLNLSKGELALLKDYYFDAKYPGDNYVIVSSEEADHCFIMVEDVKHKVEDYISSLGYCKECGAKLSPEGVCSNLQCRQAMSNPKNY